MTEVWLVFTCGPEWGSCLDLKGIWNSRESAVAYIREHLLEWQTDCGGMGFDKVTLVRHPVEAGASGYSPSRFPLATVIEITEWRHDWGPDDVQRKFIPVRDEMGLA